MDNNLDLELRLEHPAGRPLTVVQITDTHLGGAPGGLLAGMNTDESLERVLATLDADPVDPDLLLVTGDIADKGERSAYERLVARLAHFALPDVWLPGNHDNQAVMRQVAGNRMVRRVVAGNWQIILLDSQIPGAVGGELAASELEALERLAADDIDHTLVCLHHHPLPIDCAWLDEQQVTNGADLLAKVTSLPSVRAVLWGHIHQEFDRTIDSVRLLASPSTCVQFAPGAVDFLLDDEAPGYRWLTLHPNGRLDTGVVRIDNANLAVDLQCGGY